MRKSGVLLHLTSLPSEGGVGTLGRAACEFIDFVKAAGMNIWQMLPVGPTGYAESPYQSSSSRAGNPLLIDFELLVRDGLLPESAEKPVPANDNEDFVDFAEVKESKERMLRSAYAHSHERLSDVLLAFEHSHAWVRDYALFCAIKEKFGGISWMEWPDQAIRHREAAAVEKYASELADSVDYYIFGQYVFFSQWQRLHDYARASGVELMGDLPIYVAEDSADVWLNPEMFELDEELRPIRIAGVPPDYFNDDGQRWGNPLYNWKRHEESKFSWWIERLRGMSELFDILRIDHFIGFARYYAIPAGERTARKGKYELAPGKKLFRQIRKELPGLQIVAEDLGVSMKRAKDLLEFCGYPGMKLMQFAFDGSDDNENLPQNHPLHAVVYTGTHDNETTLGWWKNLDADTRAIVREKLGMADYDEDINAAMLEALWGSRAETAIAPMQDLLNLDNFARMNLPGSVGGNWLWRMRIIDYAPIAARVRQLNRRYDRGTLSKPDAAAILADAERIAAWKFHHALADLPPVELHTALSEAVMLSIAPAWEDDCCARLQKRQAIYISAEYLVGRLIYNNLFNLGLLEDLRRQLAEKGIDLADLEDIEDAALGNGGLGRLAACFLDSAATHNIPLSGYGLRYKYGLFKQCFDADGRQLELPDDWTRRGDPWSVRREERAQLVCMKGLDVRAVPYDMPVIGYGGRNIGTLRLWQCESEDEFDFDLFNAQDYEQASRGKNQAEDITKLLYPNDTLKAGKLMRLRQQYVLCSATLQDMLEDYCEIYEEDFLHFDAFYAVQLNDTHPVMAIPELIRLLMLENVPFNKAFAIAQRTFRYTNHTVMREALECWDEKLMMELSPELVKIIRRINRKLGNELQKRQAPEPDAMRILQDGRIHMANLAVYGSSYTNGVAAIHTRILREDVFREWYALWPQRFQNKTNGITQRRWLGLCNPELCRLLDETVGEGYLTDLDRLEGLKGRIDDELADRFIEIKRTKKRQLARVILRCEEIDIPENFVFSVQVKRLHEYKRQLLNALCIWDIYRSLKDGSLRDFPATAFIFGAKSAPGYKRAKAVICIINRMAKIINADPETGDLLRVCFVQNYNCSYAEHIIPAADISEQISPAGTEASGTGNMKLMLNGAVTLGTRDGANIEIFEQAGEENNFPFGATVEELNAIRETYDPMALYEANPHLRRSIDALTDGSLGEDILPPDEEGSFAELKHSLLQGASWHAPDHYFLLYDYASYMEAKLSAIRATEDPRRFAKMCLANIASAGKFSSDRTVKEYARDLWFI